MATVLAREFAGIDEVTDAGHAIGPTDLRSVAMSGAN